MPSAITRDKRRHWNSWGLFARSMICHSRVDFSFEGDELRSAPINAAEFARFCQLKSGSYR